MQTSKQNPRKQVIINDVLQQSPAPVKTFRRPKKLIKVLNIKTQQQYRQDKNKGIIQSGKFLMNQLKSCKELKRWTRNVSPFQQKRQDSHPKNNNNDFTSYSLYRSQEKVSFSLNTGQNKASQKGALLRIDLKEIQKIRFKSHRKKLPIEPTQFKSFVFSSPVSHKKSEFRPGSRQISQKMSPRQRMIPTKYLNKQSQQLSTFYEQTIKTQRSDKSYTNSPKKSRNMESIKSQQNILYKTTNKSFYKSKSKLKRLWQTMGLKTWTNKTIKH